MIWTIVFGTALWCSFGVMIPAFPANLTLDRQHRQAASTSMCPAKSRKEAGMCTGAVYPNDTNAIPECPYKTKCLNKYCCDDDDYNKDGCYNMQGQGQCECNEECETNFGEHYACSKSYCCKKGSAFQGKRCMDSTWIVGPRCNYAVDDVNKQGKREKCPPDYICNDEPGFCCLARDPLPTFAPPAKAKLAKMKALQNKPTSAKPAAAGKPKATSKPKASASCKDTVTNCNKYKNDCRTQKLPWMKTSCKKTCGLC